MKIVSLLGLTLLYLTACNTSGLDPRLVKPYKFDRDALDKLVNEKKALYSQKKRTDGSLDEEKYFLADTVSYVLEYDGRSNLIHVARYNEHGEEEWFEEYYPNGQRRLHACMKTDMRYGRPYSYYEGFYEKYYENGRVEEMGFYKKEKMRWNQKINPDGIESDTIFYDYPEEEQEQAEPEK